MNKKSQVQKFREAARAIGADEDEARFNKTLGKLAKVKPPDPPKGSKPKPKNTGRVGKG